MKSFNKMNWNEKAIEAESRMLKSKSSSAVKRWSRELQVCKMMLRSEISKLEIDDEDSKKI